MDRMSQLHILDTLLLHYGMLNGNRMCDILRINLVFIVCYTCLLFSLLHIILILCYRIFLSFGFKNIFFSFYQTKIVKRSSPNPANIPLPVVPQSIEVLMKEIETKRRMCCAIHELNRTIQWERWRYLSMPYYIKQWCVGFCYSVCHELYSAYCWVFIVFPLFYFTFWISEKVISYVTFTIKELVITQLWKWFCQILCSQWQWVIISVSCKDIRPWELRLVWKTIRVIA